METRLTALKNFVLGKDKVEAGEPFETDPATAARLVQKGIAGELETKAKKKAGKKKAAKKAGEKK
jgi:hypothetical protein